MRRATSVLLRKTLLMVFAAAVLGSGIADAHVRLNSPDGNEQLAVGSVLTIHWQVVIAHDQLGWDLYYSTTGPNGPWIPIVEGLPVGDGSNGAQHTFNWTVPDEPSDQVRIQVIQDNVVIDYDDVSNDDLSIVSGPLFLDGFEGGGTLVWTTNVD